VAFLVIITLIAVFVNFSFEAEPFQQF